MTAPGVDDAASRRGQLLDVKLRALVSTHLAEPVDAPRSSFAPGAALVHRDAAWVYLDDRPARRLGAALAWALRAGAGTLHVVAESGTGTLARRATQFSLPVSVWHAEGRTLLPAVPEPLTSPSEASPEHERFRPLIEAGGAVPVVEHGVLAGEVRGLEVCRVVDDPITGTARLEVGVGAHDREAFQMLHGAEPTPDALARVVEAVTAHRTPGAPRHPLNTLGAERLLRWRLLERPELVGVPTLEPMAPPVARDNVKDAVPCVAVGDGVVVVCGTGADLDLIPYAADARLAAEASMPSVGLVGEVDGGRRRLVVATPSRDLLRVTGELAGLLAQSADLVSVD